MPHGITRVRPTSNSISNRIEETSDTITKAIPRDMNTNSERYIIFTDGEPLPEETKQILNKMEFIAGKVFEIRALSGHDDPQRKNESYPVHAIGYENEETNERATYLFT